jgi:hypothetical protein
MWVLTTRVLYQSWKPARSQRGHSVRGITRRNFGTSGIRFQLGKPKCLTMAAAISCDKWLLREFSVQIKLSFTDSPFCSFSLM